MKTIKSILLLLTVCQLVNAQSFDKYFEDRTLRIDYIFSGNQQEQHIAVDQMSTSPRWFGKRQRMAELPVKGNGQITVRSHRDGSVVYRNSFSSLFQEWLSNDESKTETKAFENVFLVPFPKDTVDITIDLRNNRHETTTTLTHTVAPSDILIRHIGERNLTPYEIVQAPADTSRCIRIAYIAEGYTEKEMSVFMNDVKVANKAMFAHEPFRSLKDRFQVVAVKAPSKESGTSEPAKGIWKNTALHSHFDTFYMDRYLTTLHLKDLHDWLAGIPYEHIIVLVNTEQYGGGGILNSYNLAMAHHKMFKPVVVHEFGHSFGGLADEYAYENEAIPMYPHDVEPWEPNITTLADFHGKWEHMLNPKTPIPTPPSEDEKKIGVYEGAGYSLKGVYRGVQDCRMRSNVNPEFCAVCREALTKLIKFYTEPESSE